MTAATRSLCALLLPVLVAIPSGAQYPSPIAVRSSDGVSMAGVTRTSADSLLALPHADPENEFSGFRTVLGGAIGAANGGALGLGAGALVGGRGCSGELLCGLGTAVVGLVVGESLGLAVGAHLGARSERTEKIPLIFASSVGILVAAAYMGHHVNSSGTLLILAPAFQLAAALAIERR